MLRTRRLQTLVKRILRRKRTRKTLSNFLIYGGLILIGLWVSHQALYYRTLQLDQQTISLYKETAPAMSYPRPVHMSIGRMLDTPIAPAVYSGSRLTVSPDTASHLATSAYPGQKGNIIIYGHNTEAIMGNIRALNGKEIITIRTDDNVDHRYKIVDMTTVSPLQTGFLRPTEQEVLTVYTCTGPFDSKRRIVQAVPVTEEAIQT